ncbi:MAG: 3-ketoacyl-ACP reductase [Spirochaetales bacterium]|jgi:NAD(P)-dependent dehydrogenase (short-subunit alcohol dehydrogenase family)|nr:3-ketoacyl-ACP reductase [Spirochaetales bacterium]
MNELRKTAIITGGSRGIGLAISQRLGLDGYNLVVFSRKENSECREVLDRTKAPYICVQGNIANREDRSNLLAKAIEEFGRVDVLVNNAGIAPPERNDILNMTEESYDIVMNTNTKSTMFMTQIVANQMIGQPSRFIRKGTIINISSCSAVVSSPNRAEYCISKAGVSMLTTVYADRLAREGILVHEVRPGVIRTDMTSAVTDKYDNMFKEGRFPIARWGTPEDVAHVVSFLVSEGFGYSTGNYIDVDGGFHIKSL